MDKKEKKDRLKTSDIDHRASWGTYIFSTKQKEFLNSKKTLSIQT